jgi:hypothetical protein
MSKEEQHLKSVKVVIFAEDFLIWLDGQDALNQQLRMSIKKLTGQNMNVQLTPRSVELPFDPNRITWVPRTGGKGPFELSSDENNPEHKALLEFLREHAGGAMVSEGQYYWIMNDGKSIGRKPSNQVQRRGSHHES